LAGAACFVASSSRSFSVNVPASTRVRAEATMFLQGYEMTDNAGVDENSESTSPAEMCTRIHAGAHRSVRLRFRSKRSTAPRRDPGYRLVWIRRSHRVTRRRVLQWPNDHFDNGKPCHVGIFDKFDDSGD
jgi:hypothetical protein